MWGFLDSASVLIVPLWPGYLNTIEGHNGGATCVDISTVRSPFMTAVGECVSMDEGYFDNRNTCAACIAELT